jgi:hypothetical protein
LSFDTKNIIPRENVTEIWAEDENDDDNIL